MKGCKGYFLPSGAKSMAVINRVWNASRGMYIYLYDSANDVDDTVTLVAARVTQKNRNFMLAQSSAHSVDRLCSVPWIDFSKSSSICLKISFIVFLSLFKAPLGLYKHQYSCILSYVNNKMRDNV